jgi:hypothetical protein
VVAFEVAVLSDGGVAAGSIMTVLVEVAVRAALSLATY